LPQNPAAFDGDAAVGGTAGPLLLGAADLDAAVAASTLEKEGPGALLGDADTCAAVEEEETAGSALLPLPPPSFSAIVGPLFTGVEGWVPPPVESAPDEVPAAPPAAACCSSSISLRDLAFCFEATTEVVVEEEVREEGGARGVEDDLPHAARGGGTTTCDWALIPASASPDAF